MRVIFRLLLLSILCLLLVRPLQAEEKRPFWSRFSLKLTGGGGFIAVGDMNNHLESINKNDNFKYWRKHDPTSISGEIKKLNNWGYDFELELIMNINPKFSVGLATSAPFRRSNESSILFPANYDRGIGPQTIEMDYRPEIRLSFPIKLSLYYSWLSTTRFKTNIVGGIGYYPNSISEYYMHKIFPYGSSFLKTVTVSYDWSAKGKHPFGLHAGIGLEYSLNEEFSLVADIQGRFIRIGNLRGQKEYRQSSERIRVAGTLLYHTIWDPGIDASYDELVISETYDPGNENVRKAILDLSGFSLRVGVKINLY